VAARAEVRGDADGVPFAAWMREAEEASDVECVD
jgi:hypothetical protein